MLAANRRSRLVSSDRLTGITIDQWWPTGHRWKRQIPNRSALTEAPGIQIVVNR